jgi:hypothetical protein
MKNKLVCLFVLAGLLFISICTSAQDITASDARSLAKNFTHLRLEAGLAKDEPIVISDASHNCLGWIFTLKPGGYIIVSANRHIAPVFAYSTENNFDLEDPHCAALLQLMVSDMKLRAAAWERYSTKDQVRITRLWEQFGEGKSNGPKFQQWPPAGSTPTGGWLETNWTQSSPYNMYCPMDLNAGSRSIAGCPAVAMAQILNYLQKTNGTRFGTGDDYYHSYGSGNQYWIDNDSATRGFPGFGTLNFLLDSLDFIYNSKAGLSNSMKGALTFACGTACKQVYTASGSGTFGIDQAADAYQRFGFTDSRLVFDTDTNLNADLAENMKAGLCAHLGLVDSAVTVGHNVVVDGYNTDEFYHFNFGWGGSNNGWYTMPPTSIAYNLTVIEGIVLDIYGDSVPSAIQHSATNLNFSFYPNPVEESLHIEYERIYDTVDLSIFDGSGKQVFTQSYGPSKQIDIDMKGWPIGIYIITFITENSLSGHIKVIKQ